VRVEGKGKRGGLALFTDWLMSTERAMGNAISAAGNVATGDISGARTDLGETAASLGNIVGANYIPRDTPGVGFLGGGGRRRGVSDVGEFDRAISLLPDPVEPWVRAGVDIATDPVTYVSFGIGRHSKRHPVRPRQRRSQARPALEAGRRSVERRPSVC
jgi:hypothetical protein